MEMQQILNPKLTPVKRAACVVVAVFCLAFAVGCAVLAITTRIQGEDAAWARAASGGAAIFGIGWAILAGRAAIKGAINLRRDQPAMVRLTWVYSLLLVAFMLTMSFLNRYVYLGIFAVAYLVAYSLFVVQYLVQQSELNIREKLLEIELKLATMNEALAGKHE